MIYWVLTFPCRKFHFKHRYHNLHATQPELGYELDIQRTRSDCIYGTHLISLLVSGR